MLKHRTWLVLICLSLISCNYPKFENLKGSWEMEGGFNEIHFVNTDSIFFDGKYDPSSDILKYRNGRLIQGGETIQVSQISQDSIRFISNHLETVILRRLSKTVQFVPESEREFDTIRFEGMACKGYHFEGQKHGLWTCSYPNGKTASLTRYSNGKLNGTETTFDKNGELESYKFYRNGELVSSHHFKNTN